MRASKGLGVTRLLNTLAQPRVAFALTLLFAIFSYYRFDVGIVPKLRVVAHAFVLDDTLAYSLADVAARFAAYGEAGRAAYRAFLLSFDLMYAPVYAFALAALISAFAKALRMPGRSWTALASMPIVAALLDWLENAGLVLLLDQYPRLSPALVAVTSTLTIAKWSLVILSLLTIGSMLLLLLVRNVVPRGEAQPAKPFERPPW